MKVKINSTYPKKTIEVNNVFFSSDLHLNHEAVIKFGRNFGSIEEMNSDLIIEINKKVDKNDLLVLLGDTMMGEKDYTGFLFEIECENVIILFGNHCNRGKLLKVVSDCQIEKLLYVGDYLELFIDKQLISCSHYPQFNWNYQDEGSFHLHGHLHGDENTIIKEVHKYKTMDVGVDSYYNMFGVYSIFSLQEIKEVLKDKLTIGRHE
jgi:calcineurin-like phosphoesterase family protein